MYALFSSARLCPAGPAAQFPVYLGQAGIGVLQKAFIGTAETVHAGGFVPVAAAAVAAQRVPAAGAANERHRQRCFEKAQSPALLFQLCQRVGADAAQFPLVQHVEVTGVNAAIGLHHQVGGAVPLHRAALRRLPRKHHQQIFKVAVVGGLPGLKILIPGVKGGLEKLGIPLRREGIGLAAEGMKFTNAYTSSAICAPSRASVMTGLYAHKHGVIDNFTDIKEGTPLLGDCMHDAGYYCGYAGKWHVSPTLPPEGCGFDDGKPFMGYAFPGSGVFPHLVFNQPPDNVPNYYEEYLKENGFENVDVSHGFLGDNPNLQIQEMFCKHEGPVESTIEYFVAHETNRLIDKAKEEDKPFFIWANFWGPHSPSIVPEPYYSMYNPEDIPEHPSYCDDLLDKPYGYYLSEKMWGLGDYGWKGFQEIAARYYGHCTMIDDMVGLIVDSIDDAL